MNNYKILALDESGKASYLHHSDLFVLSGVVISEKFKPKLESKMRKIKKKYFGDEEIVFHSRDMHRAKGQFAALQNNTILIKFWTEFISLVNTDEISLVFIVVDKKKAKKKNWQAKTILKKCYLRIIEVFVSSQLGQNNGKIVLESDSSQDLYLIEAHNKLQNIGASDGSVNSMEYRRRITCLSLVNKSNLDIDVQLADALAPIVGMMYKNNTKIKLTKLTREEKMKKRLIERKLKYRVNPSFYVLLP